MRQRPAKSSTIAHLNITDLSNALGKRSFSAGSSE
jgi:hypothetical protein